MIPLARIQQNKFEEEITSIRNSGVQLYSQQNINFAKLRI